MSALHPIGPIRDAIKVVLEGVTGIGPVHDYDRHVSEQSQITSSFKDGAGRLHFWTVTLAPDNPFTEFDTSSVDRADINFAIRGTYALDDGDASEKVFIDLVEDVIDAFRANRTLKNPAATVIHSGPPNWVEHRHFLVVNVLCHRATLILPCRAAVAC